MRTFMKEHFPMHTFIQQQDLIKCGANQGLLNYFNKNFPDGGKIEDILEQIKKDKLNYSFWFFSTFKLNGICEWFDENGEIEHRCNYTADKIQGLCEEFYENGNIKHRWNYIYIKSRKMWMRENDIDGELV